MNDTGDDSETGPASPRPAEPPIPPEPGLIDAERLTALAGSYRDQARHLRLKARVNVRAIVGTVILMTVLVLVLPPLVNVVEDKILSAFGYQTSQLDFQRETAKQAADVRARSQRLLQMLDQRDELLDRIETSLTQPLGVFEPVYLDGVDGQPWVLAMAEADDGRVMAVGRLERGLQSVPLVLTRAANGEPWRQLPVPELPEGIVLWQVLWTGNGFLVAGGNSDSGAVWHISGETRERLFSGNLRSEGQIAIALSPDRSEFAVLTADIRVSRLQVLSINGEARRQVEFGAAEAADLAWVENDIVVALSVPTRGNEPISLLTYPANLAPDQEPLNTQLGGRTLLGFGSPYGPGSLSAFTINDQRQLREFQRAADGKWQSGGSFDRAGLGDKDIWPFGMNALFFKVIAPGSIVLGGFEDSQLVLLEQTRNRPTSRSIRLAGNLSPNTFGVVGRLDQRILLSPALVIPGAKPAPMLFAEAPLAGLPKPPSDADFRQFLEGISPGGATEVLGADATAESRGMANGLTRFAGGIRPVLQLMEEPKLFAAEALETGEALDVLSEDWEREWLARETAAQTLSRLRQADQAGSLWRNISSLAARLAVIALLIYLVNILVNLYRYNMRLAAFYQAHGDAIETALASGADIRALAGQSLSTLIRCNIPEDVTFGSRPAPPTDAIVNAIVEMTKSVRQQQQ